MEFQAYLVCLGIALGILNLIVLTGLYSSENIQNKASLMGVITIIAAITMRQIIALLQSNSLVTPNQFSRLVEVPLLIYVFGLALLLLQGLRRVMK